MSLISFRELVFGHTTEDNKHQVYSKPDTEQQSTDNLTAEKGSTTASRRGRTPNKIKETPRKTHKETKNEDSGVDDASNDRSSDLSDPEQRDNVGTTTEMNDSLDISEIALKRLDALYNSAAPLPDIPQSSQNFQTNPIALSNVHIPPSQLPRYRPPTKKKNKRKRLSRFHYSSSEDSDDTEGTLTEEKRQEEQRRREIKKIKIDRSNEWARIRLKWSRRNLDLRQEVDVGGALQAAAVAALRNGKLATVELLDNGVGRAQIGNLDSARALYPDGGTDADVSDAEAEEDSKEEVADDDNDDGDIHGQFLKRLVKKPKKLPKKESKDKVKEPEISKPYRDRLDFWELGLTAPKIDLSFHEESFVPRQKASRSNTLQPDKCDQDKYPGMRLASQLPSFGLVENEAHLRSSLLPSRSAPRYPQSQHRRQWMRLAARYLVSGPHCNKDVILANKILSLLWSPSLSDASWSKIIDSQSKACGKRLEKFLTRKVNDPLVAMNDLGLARDFKRRAKWAKSHAALSTQLEKLRSVSLPRKESLMQTSTSYIPIPGTEPPVPMMPHYFIGCEFGLSDRFAFVHRHEKVPREIVKITLSTLFARWLALPERDYGRKASLENQMLTMIEHSVRLNDSKIQRALTRRVHVVDELPLLSLYKSMMDFCSLLVNSGGRAFASFGVSGINEQDTGLKAAVSQLHNILEGSMKENGLQPFPRIHLVFALLRISTGLPGEAIRMLARDSKATDSYTTPFERVRNVLEYLESESLLVDSNYSGIPDVVEVGRLEYRFHQASESLFKCICTNSTEPEDYSWYLAIKAGALLLCSGNRIGDGAARLFPSAMQGRNAQDFFLDIVHASKSKRCDFEARPKLPKFEETRIETVRAFKLLLGLSKLQKSLRCHNEIASFLEWHQVVALIVGMEAHFLDICHMHAYHRRSWALLSQSSYAADYLRRAKDRNTLLIALANDIERVPGNIVNWRRFAGILGAVSKTVRETVDGRKEVDKNSRDILFPMTRSVLSDTPVIINDVATEKEAGRHDWTVDRRWWSDELLHISVPKVELSDILKTALMEAFASLGKTILEYEEKGGFTQDSPPSRSIGHDAIDWVEACLTKSQTETKPSVNERMKGYDDFLPKSLTQARNEAYDSQYEKVDRPNSFLAGVGEQVEVTCYKVLIRFHLFGLTDPLAMKAIKHYLHSVWIPKRNEIDRSSDSWYALKWLHSMGVNLETAL